MNIALINSLVERVSKLGAQGLHVLAWIPPASAAENLEGSFLTKLETIDSASARLWYE